MNDWIIPDWPAPGNVKALFTTRNGGVSRGANGAYASLNLGAHVNDNLADVERNRTLLRHHLPGEPRWLKQVHGTSPIWIDQTTTVTPQGDAALCRQQGAVCAVMVADCLPVFLCDTAGTTVGIVHAGWRGLAGGIEPGAGQFRTVPGNVALQAIHQLWLCAQNFECRLRRRDRCRRCRCGEHERAAEVLDEIDDPRRPRDKTADARERL